MIRVLAAVACAIALSACTSMKVAEVDPATGYFPATAKATIVKASAVDLDQRKSILLVPDLEFVKGQIGNIKYFDRIITLADLEKEIIKAGLTDKVPSVRDQIGLNNAAKHYKPFLWFHFERKGERADARGQFILTDPLTMEDLMVAETKLDFVWAGVNDQNNWYPMFNALIDYIKQNSKTYRR